MIRAKIPFGKFIRPSLVGLASLALAVIVEAQVFTAPQNLSHSCTAENAQIAVDTRGNINVVWNDFTTGNSYILFSHSTDGGATFTVPKNVSNNAGSSVFPQIAVDSGGNINLAWEDSTPGGFDIFFSRSSDGGVTFSAPKNLSNIGGVGAQIAVDSSGSIDIVWVGSGILFSRSADGGATFSPPKNVSNTGSFPGIDAPTNHGNIALDTNGNINVVWDNTPGNFDVFFSRSTNGGLTFATPKNLSNNAGTSIFSQIAVDSSGNINVVWIDTTPGNAEVFFSRSTDGGVTFTTPKNVSNDAGFSGDPVQIVVDSSDNINLVWPDNTPGNFEIFFSRSTDGGLTFSTPKDISNNAGSSESSQIAVDSTGKINVVWENNSAIFFSRSTDAGVTFSSPTGLSNNAFDPQMAVGSSNKINVIWNNFTFPPPVSDIFYSGSVSLLPPTDLRATVGNQIVFLYWTPTQPVDRYDVRRDDGTSITTINLSGGQTSLLDSGLQNGKLYTYTVTAIKNGIETAPSNFVLARPGEFAVSQPPPRPANRVLFLHGIFSDASTWDTIRDFLVTTVGWRFGGTLTYLCTDDPQTTFPLVSGDFTSAGDFFTVNFGQNLADYGSVLVGCSPLVGRPGLLHQADEVRGFIRRLRAGGATGKISIVAHSMGGLSARSYLADNPAEAVQWVSQLTTYGTPHWGVSPLNVDEAALDAQLSGLAPLLLIVPPFAISRGAEDLRVDCANGAFGGTLDYVLEAPPELFLDQLRLKLLPDDIQYFVLRGHTNISQFLTPCLLQDWDGLVTIDSADLGVVPASAPVGQPPLTTNPVPVLATDRLHTEETSDVSAILCALDLNCYRATVHSPVDIEITAPDGRSVARQLSELPGASYMQVAALGHQTATAIVPFPLGGYYTIRVVPKPGVAPSSTYTLEVLRAGVTTVLAQNQRVQDIPAEPYVVTLLPPMPIDIKPGGFPNTINSRSNGTIPVAILSTPTFNASARVDSTSLTFGRTGTEHSLAFCNSGGEDVNGDKLPDLVCHFNNSETDFTSGDTQGVLKGKTIDEIPFVGMDSVRIIN